MSNEELRKELAQDINTVVVYIGEKATATFTDKVENDALRAWIDANGYPLVETLTLNQEFIQRTARKERPLLIAFREATETSTMESQLEFIESLAKTPNEWNVHFLEASTKDYPGLAGQWGASETKFPAFVLVKFPGNAAPIIKAFDEDVEYTNENIFKWLETCITSENCPYNIKSQPIVENEEGFVKTAVGKNLKSIIFDETKDVMIELYSPDCPHCVMLAPIWESLGEAFSKVDSVVIAKVDAVANTIPEEIPLSGYPTILFFKAGKDKDPIHFDDKRELDALTKFIIDNAGIPVDKNLLVEVTPKPAENQNEGVNIQIEEDVAPSDDVKLAVEEEIKTDVEPHEGIVPPTEEVHVKDEL